MTQIGKTGKLQNSSLHCRQKVSVFGNRFPIFCVVTLQICKECQNMSKIVVDVVKRHSVLQIFHVLWIGRFLDKLISLQAGLLGDCYITQSELQFSMILYQRVFSSSKFVMYTSFTSFTPVTLLLLLSHLSQRSQLYDILKACHVMVVSFYLGQSPAKNCDR